MKKIFYPVLALCFAATGATATQAQADVIGTFTAGGFTSLNFIGIAGQNSIGRSSDGTQQRGLLYSAPGAAASPAKGADTPPAPVETPADPPVGLSGASANISTETITLTFDGQLDAKTATEVTRYNVAANGGAVAISKVALSGGGNTVVISLPDRALKIGDAVAVNYNLLDDEGRAVAGTASVTVR